MSYINNSFLQLFTKRFSYYETISRSDMRRFVKDELKTIDSMNSVSWIISDLIKMDIIESFGNDVYRLTNKEKEIKYAAFLLDIDESKKIYNKEDIDYIYTVKNNLEHDLTTYINLEPTTNVNMGDELQFSIPLNSHYYKAILLSLYHARPKNMKLTFFFDELLSTNINSNEWIYWMMRERINTTNENTIFYGKDLYPLLDNNLKLIKILIDSWRDSTWEFIYHYILNDDQETVMKKLNIKTASGFYKRKQTSNIEQIEEVFKDILNFIIKENKK